MNYSNGLNEYVNAAKICINSKIPSIFKNNGENVKGLYGTEEIIHLAYARQGSILEKGWMHDKIKCE